MPIMARVDMPSRDIRAPVSVKPMGTGLAEIDQLAEQIVPVITTVPDTSSCLRRAGHRRLLSGDRPRLRGVRSMRHHDVQDAIMSALVSTTVEGRHTRGVRG
jgi:Cu(I)/Ag(I) efflux system membrane protein CusA/SilA